VASIANRGRRDAAWPATDERGTVSVEWIVLAAVIMAAALLALAPNFSNALTTAMAAIGTQLQARVNAAGS